MEGLMAEGKEVELARRREVLLRQVAETGLMRPGSLVERFRKCGKPTCHCAAEGSVGHGPQWILTRPVKGKTVSRVITAGQLPQTRQHLASYRQFREQVHELVEVSVALCDTAIEESAASEGAAKKGGSKQPSRKRSSPKSRRS
jgi:hypothetical protein